MRRVKGCAELQCFPDTAACSNPYDIDIDCYVRRIGIRRFPDSGGKSAGAETTAVHRAKERLCVCLPGAKSGVRNPKSENKPSLR